MDLMLLLVRGFCGTAQLWLVVYKYLDFYRMYFIFYLLLHIVVDLKLKFCIRRKILPSIGTTLLVHGIDTTVSLHNVFVCRC